MYLCNPRSSGIEKKVENWSRKEMVEFGQEHSLWKKKKTEKKNEEWIQVVMIKR